MTPTYLFNGSNGPVEGADYRTTLREECHQRFSAVCPRHGEFHLGGSSSSRHRRSSGSFDPDRLDPGQSAARPLDTAANPTHGSLKALAQSFIDSGYDDVVTHAV